MTTIIQMRYSKCLTIAIICQIALFSYNDIVLRYLKLFNQTTNITIANRHFIRKTTCCRQSSLSLSHRTNNLYHKPQLTSFRTRQSIKFCQSVRLPLRFFLFILLNIFSAMHRPYTTLSSPVYHDFMSAAKLTRPVVDRPPTIFYNYPSGSRNISSTIW